MKNNRYEQEVLTIKKFIKAGNDHLAIDHIMNTLKFPPEDAVRWYNQIKSQLDF